MSTAPAKSIEKFRPAFTRIISARLGQRINRVKRAGHFTVTDSDRVDLDYQSKAHRKL